MKTKIFLITIIILSSFSLVSGKMYSITYILNGRLNGDTLEMISPVTVEKSDHNDIKELLKATKKLKKYKVPIPGMYKIVYRSKEVIIPDFKKYDGSKVVKIIMNYSEILRAYETLEKYDNVLGNTKVIRKEVWASYQNPEN